MSAGGHSDMWSGYTGNLCAVIVAGLGLGEIIKVWGDKDKTKAEYYFHIFSKQTGPSLRGKNRRRNGVFEFEDER